MKILLVYLFIINALGLFLMLADKQKAIKNKWRISESILLGNALLGGSFGCLLGMRLFHHKTRKPRFYIGIPVLFAIHTVALMLLFY